MIHSALHRRPTPLDGAAHRDLRLALPITDWTFAAGLNAIFVTGAEFADACREFPLLFVRAGKGEDGQDDIAPIAVFGLAQGENLFVGDGGRWRADYMPAVLRSYPLAIAAVDAQRFAICVDLEWPGAHGGDEGQRLFQADGQPTELLTGARTQLETLEGEVQRTRLVGRRFAELGLLQDMRFDAKLPDGREHTVDGFLTVDEAKVNALPDATVLELHRSGLLGLIHLHWVSLRNMTRMVQWHFERTGAAAAAAPAAEPVSA